MPSLLSPAALWTLVALALPLALHLWRPPPRTVPLGSLRFLQSTTRHPLRNLRWRERLLLTARLVLLGLLVLCLAGLRWPRPPLTRPEHWVLLDQTDPLPGPLLRHLQQRQREGYRTRALPPGADLWSALREIDDALPTGSAVAVFSPGRLASLRGIRPVLSHCRLEWVGTPPPAPRPTPSSSTSLALPALNVTVYHDPDRTEDARYVQAALAAVAKTTGRTIHLGTPASPAEFPFPVNADWIIWLGALPPPPGLTEHAANLLCEAPAPLTTTENADWIVPLPGGAFSTALAAPVRLWRHSPMPSLGAPVWTDAAGRPLLTLTRAGRLTSWTFASRFHPDWTDLPRTAALPAFLRSLLLPGTVPAVFAAPTQDFRLADPGQLPPAASPRCGSAANDALKTRQNWDLRGLLWLLAAVLFVIERVLGSRRAPVLAGSGPPLQPAFSR